MSVQAVPVPHEESEVRASWVPMIAIALGQMIMGVEFLIVEKKSTHNVIYMDLDRYDVR